MQRPNFERSKSKPCSGQIPKVRAGQNSSGQTCDASGKQLTGTGPHWSAGVPSGPTQGPSWEYFKSQFSLGLSPFDDISPQKRTNGSKNEDGIPTRRAFCGYTGPEWSARPFRPMLTRADQCRQHNPKQGYVQIKSNCKI